MTRMVREEHSRAVTKMERQRTAGVVGTTVCSTENVVVNGVTVLTCARRERQTNPSATAKRHASAAASGNRNQKVGRTVQA